MMILDSGPYFLSHPVGSILYLYAPATGDWSSSAYCTHCHTWC